MAAKSKKILNEIKECLLPNLATMFVTKLVSIKSTRHHLGLGTHGGFRVDGEFICREWRQSGADLATMEASV